MSHITPTILAIPSKQLLLDDWLFIRFQHEMRNFIMVHWSPYNNDPKKHRLLRPAKVTDEQFKKAYEKLFDELLALGYGPQKELSPKDDWIEIVIS